MPFAQVVKMEPAYQKTKWAREPCSHAAGYIRGYKLSSYLLAQPNPLKIMSPRIL
jgi:hypothetical protein